MSHAKDQAVDALNGDLKNYPTGVSASVCITGLDPSRYQEPKRTIYDPLETTINLSKDSDTNYLLYGLPHQVVDLHMKAREAAGGAFERSGYHNPNLPICRYTDAVIAASVASTILKLCREGYITIHKEIKF